MGPYGQAGAPKQARGDFSFVSGLYENLHAAWEIFRQASTSYQQMLRESGFGLYLVHHTRHREQCESLMGCIHVLVKEAKRSCSKRGHPFFSHSLWLINLLWETLESC